MRPLLSISLCLIVAFGNPPAFFQTAKRTAKTQPHKIKLVLGIVIDQFRYDYLTRFADQFGEGGFKLLTDRKSTRLNSSHGKLSRMPSSA